MITSFSRPNHHYNYICYLHITQSEISGMYRIYVECLVCIIIMFRAFQEFTNALCNL